MVQIVPNVSQKQILHESCVFQCSPKRSPKIWATFVWDNFSPWALKVAQSGHAGGGDNLGTKRRSSQRLKSESLPSRGSFRPKLYHKTCIRDGKERERERKWERRKKEREREYCVQFGRVRDRRKNRRLPKTYFKDDRVEHTHSLSHSFLTLFIQCVREWRERKRAHVIVFLSDAVHFFFKSWTWGGEVVDWTLLSCLNFRRRVNWKFLKFDQFGNGVTFD